MTITIIGSAEADYLSGTSGADSISGAEGNDTLRGRAGTDTLLGGDGDDHLYIDAADTVIDGGTGYDTAHVQGPAGVALNLAATNIERAYGGAGADTLTGAGAAGSVEINAGGGDDVIAGGAFADTLRGGEGNDTVDYSQSSAGVTVNLATGVGSGGSAAGDRLSGIENVVGSAFADRLTGNAGANRLEGGGGNDTLIGGTGTDTAVFAGSVFDYWATKEGFTWTIQSFSTNEGTDTIEKVEYAQFADAVIRLDTNNAPVIRSEFSVVTNEDAAPLTEYLPTGAWDFETPWLSVASFTQTGGPSASVMQEGTLLTLDPRQFNGLAAGQSANLTFSYGVSDGTDTTARTLTVTVEGRNDAPTGVVDTATTDEQTPITIDVLANDSDVDQGAVLSIVGLGTAGSMTGTTARGAMVSVVDGKVVYDPTASAEIAALPSGQPVADSFTYLVSDEHGALSQVMVSVGVNGDAPVTTERTLTFDGGTMVDAYDPKWPPSLGMDPVTPYAKFGGVYVENNFRVETLSETRFYTMESGDGPSFLGGDLDHELFAFGTPWDSPVSEQVIRFSLNDGGTFTFTGYDTERYSQFILSPEQCYWTSSSGGRFSDAQGPTADFGSVGALSQWTRVNVTSEGFSNVTYVDLHIAQPSDFMSNVSKSADNMTFVW